MELILHIGAPKTATTTIQSAIVASRDHLANHKIYTTDLLGEGNNRLLAYYCLSNRRRDPIFTATGLDVLSLAKRESVLTNILNTISRKARESGCDKILLTSEDLQSKLRQHEILRLRKKLEDITDSVKVVLYIREQAAAINSHYSTAIKGGAVRSCPQLPVPPFKFDRYNYLSLIHI